MCVHRRRPNMRPLWMALLANGVEQTGNVDLATGKFEPASAKGWNVRILYNLVYSLFACISGSSHSSVSLSEQAVFS